MEFFDNIHLWMKTRKFSQLYNLRSNTGTPSVVITPTRRWQKGAREARLLSDRNARETMKFLSESALPPLLYIYYIDTFPSATSSMIWMKLRGRERKRKGERVREREKESSDDTRRGSRELLKLFLALTQFLPQEMPVSCCLSCARGSNTSARRRERERERETLCTSEREEEKIKEPTGRRTRPKESKKERVTRR